MISDEPTSTDEPDTEPPGTDEPEYESEEEGSGEGEGNNGIDCNDWCLPNKKTKPHAFIRCDPIKHLINMKRKGDPIKIQTGRSARVFRTIKDCEKCKFCVFSDVCKKCPKEVEVEDSNEGSGEEGDEVNCNNWCKVDNDWDDIHKKCKKYLSNFVPTNPDPELLKNCKKCTWCEHSNECRACPIVDPPDVIG